MSGESRRDLLEWLNTTFQLSYTKVEQCGTGAAYCQILDSIYGDIPMGRLKFEAKTEYEYLDNMKVLQAALQKHHITKIIDVSRLVKCRLQDNLELLQWFKKYWLDHQQVNAEYDPVARRNIKRVASRVPSLSGMHNGVHSVPSSAQPRAKRVTSTPVAQTPRTVSAASRPNTKVNELTTQLAEANNTIDKLQAELEMTRVEHTGLQSERHFFFRKLRDIEILVGNIDLFLKEDLQPEFIDFVDKVREILFKQEEGFFVANDDEEVDEMDESETF